MTEREGTAEDFARLFGGQAEPMDEELVEGATADADTSEAEREAEAAVDHDAEFIRRLFEPKRGHTEFIRSIHGDGTP